jgi:hypothetical protein
VRSSVVGWFTSTTATDDAVQPLAFASILAGALLLVAGVTGSTLTSTAQGHPDKSKSAPAVDETTGGTGAVAAATSSPEPAHVTGAWRSTQSAIAHDKGWSLADWNAVIGKESGGDPRSLNKGSGAFGIGQFLPMNRAAYPDAFSTNPVLQIKAMARYIADRYGTPTAALAHEHAYGWY